MCHRPGHPSGEPCQRNRSGEATSPARRHRETRDRYVRVWPAVRGGDVSCCCSCSFPFLESRMRTFNLVPAFNICSYRFSVYYHPLLSHCSCRLSFSADPPSGVLVLLSSCFLASVVVFLFFSSVSWF